jgi:hypothetical protein
LTIHTASALIAILFVSCTSNSKTAAPDSKALPLVGTWQLKQATLIEKGDTTVTDYTEKTSFIKIINDSHFAFLQHDVNKGKDSSASFVAGGGKYTLKDSLYTEQLEYCSAREWEGHDFPFTLTITGDTLTQFGREVVAEAGVDRINIEKYVRVKK